MCGKCGARVAEVSTPLLPASPAFASPRSYTPKHLAEKILTSRSALEGERKQVTVLFADLKGSMELLADRDPEEARKLLDLGSVLRNSHRSCAEFRGTARSNVTRYIAQSALQKKKNQRSDRNTRGTVSDR